LERILSLVPKIVSQVVPNKKKTLKRRFKISPSQSITTFSSYVAAGDEIQLNPTTFNPVKLRQLRRAPLSLLPFHPSLQRTFSTSKSPNENWISRFFEEKGETVRGRGVHDGVGGASPD